MRNIPVKYVVILMFTFGICVAYGWSYLHLRQNKSIIHYHVICDNPHTVEARLPDGPYLFAIAVSNNVAAEDALSACIRRVELINLVYFPLRKIEEIYWSL